MQKEEYFVRIPVSMLLDTKLTRSSIALFAILLDAADKNGIIELTLDQMSSRTTLSEKTVRRSERQLMDAGYINVTRTGRASLISLTRKGLAIKVHEYSAVMLYKGA